MGYRKGSFAPGEWYHCFTRSIDGRDVFTSQADYDRFTEALYLSNSKNRIVRGNIKRTPHEEIFSLDLGSNRLVAVGAYCIMPNHFHLLVKEVADGGVVQFMQRLGTSFAMYYNIKYLHIGNVFVKPFRSKHIDTDVYAQRVAEYIHLNPVELYEPQWKKGRVRNLRSLHRMLSEYQYSSLPDYLPECRARAEREILDSVAMKLFAKQKSDTSLEDLLLERRDYYAGTPV